MLERTIFNSGWIVQEHVIKLNIYISIGWLECHVCQHNQNKWLISTKVCSLLKETLADCNVHLEVPLCCMWSCNERSLILDEDLRSKPGASSTCDLLQVNPAQRSHTVYFLFIKVYPHRAKNGSENEKCFLWLCERAFHLACYLFRRVGVMQSSSLIQTHLCNG